MAEFVKKIGMKTLQGPFASYVDVEGNKGLTCVVMIETSHIAMHVWDEPVPAKIQFDLYTCGTLEEDFALQNIIDFLKLENYEYMVLERESGFNIVKEDSTS
jgi:S-adenosylmethionine/arginine decarboxylase-like enzyme